MKKILDNGFAYESDGSIYFDVEAYNKNTAMGNYPAAGWKSYLPTPVS
ncbi:MAG: hypothetical protein ACLU30_17345 [Odoribacter splanchnicus]